ncbi:hypothetical protein AB0N31_20845 [Streptomyces sp. NPDC051051]|uniref:hypothetical protein n=1 Tax=Streptomyces sp. NPDC051051 TaxID=3155666 RepID=UPI003428F6AE
MSRGGTLARNSRRPRRPSSRSCRPPARRTQDETTAGRTVLRLDPDGLCRPAAHCRAEDAPAEVEERCPRLRFRARSALHKSKLIG